MSGLCDQYLSERFTDNSSTPGAWYKLVIHFKAPALQAHHCSDRKHHSHITVGTTLDMSEVGLTHHGVLLAEQHQVIVTVVLVLPRLQDEARKAEVTPLQGIEEF